MSGSPRFFQDFVDLKQPGFNGKFPGGVLKHLRAVKHEISGSRNLKQSVFFQRIRIRPGLFLKVARVLVDKRWIG